MLRLQALSCLTSGMHYSIAIKQAQLLYSCLNFWQKILKVLDSFCIVKFHHYLNEFISLLGCGLCLIVYWPHAVIPDSMAEQILL